MNSLLLWTENTGLPHHKSGPSRDRNIISSAAAASSEVQTNLTAYVGNGGEAAMQSIFKSLLDTGKYDGLVRERYSALENGVLPTPNLKLNILGSGEDIPAFQEAERKAREAAEKRLPANTIANDPNIGAMNENVSMEELESQM